MTDNTSKNIKFLHLTDADLSIESRNKPFEKITINDFNINITEASKSLCIFFVDTRQKNYWLKQLFKLNLNKINRVKQLVL
jgi:hypothetical protein